jgi:hypothetical protein
MGRDRGLRGDEHELQILTQRGQQRQVVGGRPSDSVACSDEPTRPALRTALDFLVGHVADLADACPLGQQRLVEWRQRQEGLQKIDSDRPTTFQASSAVKLRNGAIQRSMACVICHRAVWALRRASEAGPAGVQAVLQDVEVEGAQVLAAIDLQLGHDRVELVHLVVRQDVGLQLASRDSA